jgi:hypothetical protein
VPSPPVSTLLASSVASPYAYIILTPAGLFRLLAYFSASSHVRLNKSACVSPRRIAGM